MANTPYSHSPLPSSIPRYPHTPPPPPYLGMHFSLSVRTLADCSHSLSTNATVSSPDIAPRLTWAGGLGDFYFNLISILRRREEVWITPGEARLP